MNRALAREIRYLMDMRDYEQGKLPPTSDRARHIADINLKQWARGYKYHDKREIKADTGVKNDTALGARFKISGEYNSIYDEPITEVNDSRYRALNAIVRRLTSESYAVVCRHYLDDTKKRDLIKAVGMSSRTYYKMLSNAQNEFILLGGI